MGHYESCRDASCPTCNGVIGKCKCVQIQKKPETKNTYINSNDWKGQKSTTHRPKSDPPFQMVRNPLIHSGASTKLPDYNPDFKVFEEAVANLHKDKLLMYIHEDTNVPEEVKKYLKEKDIEIVIHPALPIGQALLFKVPTEDSAIVIPVLDIESKTCFNCGNYGTCTDEQAKKCSEEGIGWEPSK